MSKKSQTKYLDELELPMEIMDQIESLCKKEKFSSYKRNKLIEEVKKRYLKSSFEPGEAIGIISAQSLSEPATQMSTDYNERLILKMDDNIRILKIGEFVDEMLDSYNFEREKGHEICDLPEGVDVFTLSLDQDEKIKWKRISSCIRHKTNEKLMKIKTKSGRIITATDHHSFLIRKNNKVIPIAGKKLSISDRIPVMKYLPENCNGHLNMLDYVPSDRYFVKDRQIFSSTHDINKIPEKIPLNSIFGWFSGAYLSEGSCLNSQIRITNISKGFSTNFKNFAQMLNVDFKTREYRGAFGPSRDFEINSCVFSRFIENTCGKGSYNKRVPEFAYSAKENFVSGLLRGYFDGDGSVSVSRKMIRVHSNSEELIDGIKLLLTRFGIFASKNKDEKQYYLLIPYKYAPIFLSRIGSDIEKKRKRLVKLSEMAEKFWDNSSQDFTDMISGFGDLFHRTAKKLNYPTRYVNNFTKRQKIGRTTLYRYINLFERLAKEKNVDIDEELEIMKRMFNSDVVWDEIVEISYVKPTKEYVYDLSVDGLETFTTFDGIVTHNTMRTYHFAGSAGLQVTLGLPRLIEIFDARKEPRTPTMTVYLRGKYNTQKKAERFANKIKEKKMKSYLDSVSLDLTDKRIRAKLKDTKKSEREEIVKLINKKFRRNKVTVRQSRVTIESKDEDKELSTKYLRKLKKRLLNINVLGLKGVSNAVVLREGDDWVIRTFGSNYSEVLKMEEVDSKRCHTNNFYEVQEVLGIEATRRALIEETKSTMSQQGLNVDDRHVMILTDIMVFTGELEAIGRYGVAGMKSSVLTRAGFEETVKHLIKASVRSEVDDFSGLFENVMINQQVPVGTGIFDLVARMGED